MATQDEARMQLAPRWSAPEVERRPRLGVAEFLRDYVARLRPVVIPEAVAHWPAVGTWTPEWFGRRYGDLLIGDDGGAATLADVVAAIDDESVDERLYARNINIERLDADLVAAMSPPSAHVTVDNWLLSRLVPAVPRDRFGGELFIAPVEMRYPFLHWDSSHIHANIFMIHGTKEIALFAPDQAPYVYPVPGATQIAHRSAVDDVYDPDLDTYPRFAEARGTLVTVEAGDHLFIPGGWWHTVRSRTPSISVVVKSANASNWQHIRRDFPQRFRRWSPARAASGWYLAAVGAVLARRSVTT